MAANHVAEYVQSVSPDKIDTSFLAYIANLSEVARVAPDIVKNIVLELESQRSNLKLIASENYSSLATQLAMGNLLTDKYAEGFPQHRFYAGCDNVDAIESIAAEEACKLFGAEFAFVQPHSGADANLIAFWAILMTRIEAKLLADYNETNLYKLSDAQWAELKTTLGSQRLLALDYYSGGHLTHGYRYNLSARLFDVYSYAVRKETKLLDYDEIEAQAEKVKPLILLVGYSAYPREINFKRMRQIADKVGAVLMVDMAHFAGLVAGKVFTGDFDPVVHAHIVTSTTHKTLRGPRGGIVLSKTEFADAINKACPIAMGGPLPHVMAAKAVAFKEANTAEFRSYAKKIVENSRTFAAAAVEQGMTVLTGGTDNHLFLIDVTGFGLTGRQAESALRECGVTLNRNSLPYDANGPWYTSGLRVGTPAVTTLGMGSAEMKEIAAIFALILKNTKAAISEKDGKPSLAKFQIVEAAKNEAKSRISKLLNRFPVYANLDLDFLKKAFVP